MKSKQLWFVGAKSVEIRMNDIKDPGVGEIQVESLFSAISPGTEMKVFRGEFFSSNDNECSSLKNSACSDIFEFPMRYGYCLVGKVLKLGADVTDVSVGDRVLCFASHSSLFNILAENVIVVPSDINSRDAIFFPNTETSINFVHDIRPMAGENIGIFGQGIVGLLTTSILSRFPLVKVATFDLCAKRQALSRSCGAHYSYNPNSETFKLDVSANFPDGLDAVLEVSGSSVALGQAVQCTGYHGRVIIGSWYGSNNLNVNLGPQFHRSHITIKASQVTALPPELSGRWSKRRRSDLVWDMIRQIKPASFISQTYALSAAQSAYDTLDKSTNSIQPIFDYSL